MLDFLWSRKKLLFLAFGVVFIGIFFISDFIARKQIPEPSFSLGEPFSLINHLGEPITEQAFKGSPSLLFFGFTYCPEICPTTLVDLSRIIENMGIELPIYFVTLDPDRDTPEQLANYLPYFGENITGITGPLEEVLSLANSWGIYRKKVVTAEDDYTIDHTATVFMLSNKGDFAGTIAWKEAEQVVVQKLQKLLVK
ncbi:MAG: SCO family protein [Alphaproteobacteria bacterium]|nr:SCO family protein [Alphaproteobacteria bacterium]